MNDPAKAGRALRAYRRGEENMLAEVGSILEADAYACLRTLRAFARGFSK